MKYRHAFWLGLPFMVLGIGKVIHKFKGHHNFCCGENQKHKHLLTFLSWRLGLSPEQKSTLHTLIKGTHESLEGLTSKKKQLQEVIASSFSQETIDAEKLFGTFDSKDFEQARSVIASTFEQFHKLLTPLQREKVQAHLQRRRGHFHHCC